MVLVRGVICLSLSDWVPAVAPSLAPLRSPWPPTPHLSQMGGRVDGLRWEQGRDGGRDGGTQAGTDLQTEEKSQAKA